MGKIWLNTATATIGLIFACYLQASLASAVWFADDENIQRIDPVTNQISLRLRASDIRSLAAAPDGSVWALQRKRLKQYGPSGEVLVDLDLKFLNVNGAGLTALDPRDNSLWIAEGGDGDENGQHQEHAGRLKRAIRIDSFGHLVQDIAIPSHIRAMVVGLDQSLWLLGKTMLWNYARTGQQLSAVDLKAAAKEKVRLFATDSIGAWLWLVAERRLHRVDGDRLTDKFLKVDLPNKVEAIGIDPAQGSVWVVTEKTLYLLLDDGSVSKAIDLKSMGISTPKILVPDSANGTFWLGHDDAISRFKMDGTRVATIAVKGDIEQLSAAPLILQPTVAITGPTAGKSTNNPLSTVTLELGASCSHRPCGFIGDYFDSYQVNANLNGEEIGTLFAQTASATERSFTPTTRMPEGENVLTAQVSDSFGQASVKEVLRFVVDTKAPSFIAVLPENGAVKITPAATVAGTLDETVFVSVMHNGKTQTAHGENFSFSLNLDSGSNSIILAAIDSAGNRTTRSIDVSYDATPLSITNLIPESGAILAGRKVSIEGRVSESSDVLLSGNGSSTQSISGTDFSFPVVLNPGDNSYRIDVATKLGKVAVAHINLIYVPLTLTVASPPDGAEVDKENVLVTGTYTGPSRTRVTVNSLEATVSNGSFSIIVPLAAGPNVLDVSAISPDGKAIVGQRVVVLRQEASTAPVVRIASPVDGEEFVAPATIFVRASAYDANGNVQSVRISNDSSFGFSRSNRETEFAEYEWTGVPEGQYLINATTYGESGIEVTKTVSVKVLSQDEPFLRVWEGLTRALLAGNNDAAVDYIAVDAREKYARVFVDLMPYMHEVLGSLNELRRLSVDENVAEYFISQREVGTNRELGFLINFIKDGNGVWRIANL